MESKIKIRSLKIQDFEKGFFETISNLSPLGKLSMKKARKIFSELSASTYHPIYVAELNGQVVGTVTLLIQQNFSHSLSKSAHIENLVVRSGFQKKGIGSMLVSHSVKKAKSLGCYKIILDCSEGNVGFYEKTGFNKHGIEMRMDFK